MVRLSVVALAAALGACSGPDHPSQATPVPTPATNAFAMNNAEAILALNIVWAARGNPDRFHVVEETPANGPYVVALCADRPVCVHLVAPSIERPVTSMDVVTPLGLSPLDMAAREDGQRALLEIAGAPSAYDVVYGLSHDALSGTASRTDAGGHCMGAHVVGERLITVIGADACRR